MTTFKDFKPYLKEMYVTLKFDDSGCRIHSVSDGDKKNSYQQKMVTRYGKNMTLKEAVEEIKTEGEERRLVI